MTTFSYGVEVGFAGTPDTAQQPHAAADAFFVPVARLFGRCDVEQKEPHRVDADLLCGLVDADDITARLRHLLAVVEHEPLMKEARKGFVGAAHPAAIVEV